MDKMCVTFSACIPSVADLGLPELCLNKKTDLPDLNYCTHLQTVLNPKKQWNSILQAVKINDTLFPRNFNLSNISSRFELMSQHMTSQHDIIFYLHGRRKVYNKHMQSFTHVGSLNPFPNKPWFLLVCVKILLKTLWEKEKLLVMTNFSFSHSVFYPFEELSAIVFKFKIVVCILFQLGRV